MRTFELEEEIKGVLDEKGLSVEQLKEAYAILGEKAVQYSLESQSLEEAVLEVAPKQIAEAIGKKRNELFESHIFRHITPEMAEVLSAYGYNKPVVLLEEEEALEAFEEGKEILLLFQGDKEKIASSIEEIGNHVENNGLLAMTQLSMDEEIEFLLSGKDYE